MTFEIILILIKYLRIYNISIHINFYQNGFINECLRKNFLKFAERRKDVKTERRKEKSASFTNLNPSNYLRSDYQKHCSHQNSNHCNFFPINFKNMFAKKELSVYIYREKKNIA